MYGPPPNGAYPPASYPPQQSPAQAPGFQGSPPVSSSPPGAGSPWHLTPGSTPESRTVPPSQFWREHQTPEGRKYWFNTATRQSTWEKPEELLTPEEKALMNCPWKEYKTPEGRTYYSHIQTKESKWTMPDEYRELYEKAQAAKQRAAAEAMATPMPGVGARPPMAPGQPEMDNRPQRPIRQPPPSATLISQAPVVEFPTKEEAEKAFFKLLKETGVKTDWTWEQTMRAIITHPMYRALKTTSERKAAFEAYIDREAKREKELREEKEMKQRVAFFHMLENTKEIKPYTRYRTAVKLLSHNSAFTQIKSDSQRESYFEEYVHGLQRREKERLRELRKSSMDNFADLLRRIPEITFKTKWKEAQNLYMSHPEFEKPNAFEGMDLLDFLSVYEEHSRALWEVPIKEQERKARERRRADRKAREGFRALLNELTEKGLITARTMWKEIYPEIKDDPRYRDLLGVPDSSPFDLFCDLLDDLDERLYEEKKVVYHVLKEHNFEVTVDTSYEEYRAVLARDEEITRRASETNIKIIFDHLQNKASSRLKEEKRRQEKKLKKKIDALRHALKYLEPPISTEDTWETVEPRLADLPEYQAIESKEAQQEAFDKYVKRLKEKEAKQEDEDEEGMIREEDEDRYAKHHTRSNSRSSRRHRHYYERKEMDWDSDRGTGYSDEERLRRKKRRRYMVHHHDDNIDRPIDVGHSSAEEGEALDEYMSSSRK